MKMNRLSEWVRKSFNENCGDMKAKKNKGSERSLAFKRGTLIWLPAASLLRTFPCDTDEYIFFIYVYRSSVLIFVSFLWEIKVCWNGKRKNFFRSRNERKNEKLPVKSFSILCEFTLPFSDESISPLLDERNFK